MGYGAGDTNILTVRMMSYDQFFGLFEFFIKDVFSFIWCIIRPNMDNDIVRLFLDLGLSETLDLLFLRQEKNAPLSLVT